MPAEGAGAGEPSLVPFQALAERGLATEARKRQWEDRCWPRGPRLDIVGEADRVVRAAIGQKRRRAEVPLRVDVPQLEECQPLDWRVVPPLPTDRPLRVLELLAGVGAKTQALARVRYMIGEVVACELRGAARQVHQHAMT
jgi:hypothetical protein